MTNVSELANSDPLQDFVSDCRLMLRFARKNGTDLSPELEHEIAQLDSILKQLKLSPVSDIDPVLVSDSLLPAGDGPLIQPAAADYAAAAPARSVTELILRVHGELSKVITPATALSLQTTEPPSTGHTFFGGMPLVVKAAAVAALLCAVGFVASAGVIGAKAAADAKVAKAEEDAKIAQQKVEIAKVEEAKKAEEKKKRADSEGEKK
jgi:hypothetical protein